MPTELDVFLQPRSVAVIGATERLGSWGSFIMEGLLSFPYPGKIYPVNQHSSTVYGTRAYPDVKSIPDSVELAVLTIPEASVERVVQDCCEKGVKGITIITSGFGEAIEGGQAREQAIAKLARAHGVRVVGPNVSGTFNLHAGFNASPLQYLLATPLAGISQGGYAFGDLLASGYGRRMGVGKFIHTGNECDLQVTDFLDYFGKDPQVRGIVMYVETLRDGRRFLEVARRVGRDKPIIVHKAGCTSGGIRAARSHTGAMAGSKEVYSAALQQVNVILSPSMELLLPLGHALIERPRMRGKRVAIVTMGGSWGVALSDRLEEEGLIVPELSWSTQARLRSLGMPLRASASNPVDIGAAGVMALSVEKLIEIGQVIVASGEVDALILHGLGRVGFVHNETPDRRKISLELEKQLMRGYDGLQEESHKPVILGSHHSSWDSQTISDLQGEGLRVLNRLEEIAQILYRMYEYWRKMPEGE
ncbi:MAG: acetate--CoA ligase family protein [bacterium]